MQRRHLLKGLTAAFAGLAGCSGNSDETPNEDGEDQQETTREQTQTTDDGNPTKQVVESPQATFSFELTSDSGSLEITHVSGDAILASNLYVRDTFDGSAENGNWTSFGAYDASSDIDGKPAVTAGDKVTISGVGTAYDLGVFWDTGQRSATLARGTGPSA
jgi:hypothetical protein